MASTFTVEYSQGDSGPGMLTISIDGSVQVLPASGRLDAVGNRIVSPKFALGVPEVPGGVPGATVECIRTSSSSMRIVLVVHLGVYVGPAYERVIEDVPIDFD